MPHQSADSWLDKFRDDESLRGLVTWLDAAQQEEHKASLQGLYKAGWSLGILWTDTLWEAAKEDAARMTPVALGPSRKDRQGTTLQSLLYTDGQELFFALSERFPPWLWIACPDPASLLALLHDWYPMRVLRRAEFPRVHRAHMGFIQELWVPNPYSGELTHAYPHDLQRHWTFSPYMDVHQWGSSQAEDPWAEDLSGKSSVAMIIATRDWIKQADGGLCSFTRRSHHSGSWLTMELHGSCMYVQEWRYRPGLSRDAVTRFNQRFNAGYPEDMPVDLLGAVLGFYYYTPEFLEQGLAEGPPENPGVYLPILAALYCHDLVALTAHLRRWADHPDRDVRENVQMSALFYNLQFFFLERLDKETDMDLLTFAMQVAQDGIAAEQFTDVGEPVDLYRGEGEE